MNHVWFIFTLADSWTKTEKISQMVKHLNSGGGTWHKNVAGKTFSGASGKYSAHVIVILLMLFLHTEADSVDLRRAIQTVSGKVQCKVTLNTLIYQFASSVVH